MPTLERSIEIMRYAHEGQFRFDGQLYETHPLGVLAIAQTLRYTEPTLHLCVLHDTVEDSKGRVTLDSLANEGYDDDVLVPLDLMTKKPGEDYREYIERLAPNPRSRAAKKIDLFKNMDLTGIENPTRKQIMNIEKYGHYLAYLAKFPQPLV